jgi:hypothetical protein
MNNKLTNNFDQDTDVFAKLFSNFFKFATALAIIGSIFLMTLFVAFFCVSYTLIQYLNQYLNK